MSRRFLTIMLTIMVLACGAVAGWQLYSNHHTPAASSGSVTQKTTPVSPPPANGTQPNTGHPQTYLVRVHFSKHPDSDNDPSATFPVNRTSDTLGVARFAIAELLKGPTASEQSANYFTTVKLRDGTSSCGGQDFKLSISGGTATLQFCRPFDHLGVVADGQANSELKATLMQFGSVKKVVVLNQSGDCEFDLSGLNLCKQ